MELISCDELGPESLRAWAQAVALIATAHYHFAILPAFIMSGVIDTGSRHLQDPIDHHYTGCGPALWSFRDASDVRLELWVPVWMQLVRLAPLPSIMLKGTSLKHRVCWRHRADTPHPCHSSGHGMPALAMAAVAWSWVEKISQLTTAIPHHPGRRGSHRGQQSPGG